MYNKLQNNGGIRYAKEFQPPKRMLSQQNKVKKILCTHLFDVPQQKETTQFQNKIKQVQEKINQTGQHGG